MRHIDFLSPGLGDELWRILARYRREEPVVWVPSVGMFCVFRYNDIRACLASPDFTVDYPFRVSRQVFGETLLDIEGQRHSRLRRKLGALLIGRDGNKPFLGQADHCIDSILEAMRSSTTELDFVEAVAQVLPKAVTASFMGIADKDRDWLFEHLRYLIDHLDGSSGSFAIADEKCSAVREYARRQLQDPQQPNQTAIGQLGISVRSGELDIEDAIGMVLIVLAAGVETSAGLLANTMVALDSHPRWREWPNSERSVWERVVHEVARWQPPQMDTVRFARKDTELGGVSVAAGQPLKLVLGSGNRDEAVFVDSDSFRPDRPERASLSFGYGPHSCLGMHLAIQVAARFFAAFFARYPRSVVEGPVPPIDGWTFRMPSSLPVSLGQPALSGYSVS